jgi:hypothetical protein
MEILLLSYYTISYPSTEVMIFDYELETGVLLNFMFCFSTSTDIYIKRNSLLKMDCPPNTKSG